jgi:hypothetical protein
MVHHPKDIQTTWHNRGKRWSQHRPASLWNAFDTLQSPNAPVGFYAGINVYRYCTLEVFMDPAAPE